MSGHRSMPLAALLLSTTAIPDNNTTGVSRHMTLPDDIAIEHVEVVLDAAHSLSGRLEDRAHFAFRHAIDPGREREPTPAAITVGFSPRSADWGEASAGNWSLKIADLGPGLHRIFHFLAVECLRHAIGRGLW